MNVHSPNPGPAPWSEAELTRLVNDALRSYHSLLALARSPLAHSALVAPLLVLDDLSPTAQERGQALRLTLAATVDQLAPGRMRFPLGVYRPPDDPTWREPRYWRYNILRHCYVEPLRPEEYVDGGRLAETLLALTGIPSVDTFFDERSRAMREVAQRLRRRLLAAEPDPELQQIAVDAACLPLNDRPDAAELLGIAATFNGVFPRALLLQMAAAERLAEPVELLDYLTAHRLLLAGERGRNLWLSPVLQDRLYRRQPRDRLSLRHARAASHFLTNGEPLPAAQHFLHARQWTMAATLLLDAAQELIDEMQVDDLCHALAAFPPDPLPPDVWRDTRLLLGDLLAETGRRHDALVALDQALEVVTEPADQARIFRRMGKLHEAGDPQQALEEYRQAIELLRGDDPERIRLLKDRALLRLARREWTEAEADLSAALVHIAQQPAEVSADIRAEVYDALALLYRHKRQFAQAIRYARMALAQREEAGDLLRAARALNNLGLIYDDMGDPQHAVAAYRAAVDAYEKLGNQELMAGTLLNIGAAQHQDGQPAAAAGTYRQSLALCQELDLPRIEVRARFSLAEVCAALGETDDARGHWQAGYQRSLEAGLDEEAEGFRELQADLPALRDVASDTAASAASAANDDGQDDTGQFARHAAPDDQEILDLARDQGAITTRALMTATGVSKATATRRLAALAEAGRLARHGAGRGAYYVVADPNAAHTVAAHAAADLRRLLAEHGPRLASRYQLSALGLAESPAAIAAIVARFDREPDLARFFALEAELAELAGRTVDLTPEAAHTARGILWVWQAADVQA
ncbi:MAG: tetratricopeptide repeat protein [Chloroflexota bacterium]|nr:tetratricopeptide repeat protein [Chloroflexota bacterium]